MEDKKLIEAIVFFTNKVSKQGYIKNARDVEHLERLKGIYLELYGLPFEYKSPKISN